MARLGGEVTGIKVQKNIKIAKLHSIQSNLKIEYVNTSPEKLNKTQQYDNFKFRDCRACR